MKTRISTRNETASCCYNVCIANVCVRWRSDPWRPELLRDPSSTRVAWCAARVQARGQVEVQKCVFSIAVPPGFNYNILTTKSGKFVSMAKAVEAFVEVHGRLASFVLNRPKALNALNLPMVHTLTAAYERCVADPAISCILMRGAGGKAFCAGGDVKGVWQAASGVGDPPPDPSLPDTFFRDEYTLNAAIAACPKPQVSLWDGIVMGGGAGLSVHGRYRIASERALFAMPETMIGFVPDVGASHFLSRLPGALGEYLALTGVRIGPADLLHTGLATHFVPSGSIESLEGSLRGCADDAAIASALASKSTSAPGDAPLANLHEEIDRCFGADSIEEIESRLELEASSGARSGAGSGAAGDGEWAKDALVAMRAVSPTSLRLALRLVREGRRRSLHECLQAEFRVSQRLMVQPSDFFEGIRAALVDKDKQPRWAAPPAAEEIDAHFAMLGERELDLDSQGRMSNSARAAL